MVAQINNNETVVWQRAYDKRQMSKTAGVKKRRFHWQWLVVILCLFMGLSVYMPVMYQEFRFQARMTAVSLRSAYPNGIAGFIIPDLGSTFASQESREFRLSIPKLQLSEVVTENVDPTNKPVYMAALQSGVAHAAGTMLPGEQGMGYYFGHSSGLPIWGLRTVPFAMLYRLEEGDEITLSRDGETYYYQVTGKTVVEPDDVEALLAAPDREVVVLQTCWPIGTDWKRLLVLADRIDTPIYAFSGVDR